MITRPIEDMIGDPSYQDDEVEGAWLDAIEKETPDRERDGLTTKEWQRRIDVFEQTQEHRRTLIQQHRPKLWERMQKEVADQHYYCCGPGATKE